MKIKLLQLLIAFFFTPLLVKAHSLDQIKYAFDQDEKGGFITVYFTPNSAMDLIINLNPELKDQSIIRLENYFNDITDYFNETITILINGQSTKLYFVKGDLISHEATMVYRFDEDLVYQGDIDITITSFNEIYRRIKNHIVLNTKSGNQECILNAEITNCLLRLDEVVVENKTSVSYCWLGGLFLSILILIGILKRNKYKKAESNS